MKANRTGVDRTELALLRNVALSAAAYLKSQTTVDYAVLQASLARLNTHTGDYYQ